MALGGMSSWLVLLLALGASPAVAQDYRIGSPDPVQIAEAPAPPKPDATKPTTPHIAALTPSIPLPKAALRPVLAKPEPAKSEAPLPRVRPEIAKTETAMVAPAKPGIGPAAPSIAPNPLAGIPLDERLNIQSALLWSGDYTGVASG